MSRRVIPGLEAPDPALEREVRARLDEVERALEEAVRADSEMLAETAQYLLAAGGKRFRPMLVLLAGYSYAHGVNTWLSQRKQVVLHLVMLGVALVLLGACGRYVALRPAPRAGISAPVGHACTHSPHATQVESPIGSSRSNTIFACSPRNA